MKFTFRATALLLPCLLLFHASIHAQKNFGNTLNQLRISPLKLIDPVNPGITVAYERKIKQHFAIENSYTWLNDFFNVATYQSFSGYGIGLEGKYIKDPMKYQRLYLSLSSLYSFVRFNSIATFESNSGYYVDSFRAKKNIYSVSLKVGYEFLIKRIVIDLCAGLGVRHRSVVHSQRLNPSDVMLAPRHPNIHYEAEHPGSYGNFMLPLGFKVGFIF